MHPRRGLLMSLLGLTALATVGIWVEQRRAAEYRREVEQLRAEYQSLVRLESENRQLAEALPTAATLNAWRADRAAVLQLRAEIEDLKSNVERREHAFARQAAAERGPVGVR